MNSMAQRTVRFAFVIGMAAASCAQASTDNSNASNNPLTHRRAFNIQNYFVPGGYGNAAGQNDAMLRFMEPIAPNAVVRTPELFRLTVPISTRRAAGRGEMTGIGDINLFDIFLFGDGNTKFGAGPLVTAPTATDRALGTGKWQAGLAAIAIDTSERGLLGALVQWQHSFAGNGERPAVQTLTAQPLFILNLKENWYFRSTAISTFDFQHGAYVVPMGVGFGKVWDEHDVIYNLFVEPQYAPLRRGNFPRLQVYAGLNMMFKK